MTLNDLPTTYDEAHNAYESSKARTKANDYIVIANNTRLERYVLRSTDSLNYTWHKLAQAHFNLEANQTPKGNGPKAQEYYDYEPVCYAVRYHATVIAEFYPNGDLWVTHGGYDTVTTKQRLNIILRPTPYSIYSHNPARQRGGGSAWVHKLGKPIEPLNDALGYLIEP